MISRKASTCSMPGIWEYASFDLRNDIEEHLSHRIYVVQDYKCHRGITCFSWCDPELTQTLNSGFEDSYKNLTPDSCSAVGQTQHSTWSSQKEERAYLFKLHHTVYTVHEC